MSTDPILEDYRDLLKRFLTLDITVFEFERVYLKTFKSDSTIRDEKIYNILNELFHAVDAFCEDPPLRDQTT
jgi:hypothetical protein